MIFSVRTVNKFIVEDFLGELKLLLREVKQQEIFLKEYHKKIQVKQTLVLVICSLSKNSVSGSWRSRDLIRHFFCKSDIPLIHSGINLWDIPWVLRQVKSTLLLLIIIIPLEDYK